MVRLNCCWGGIARDVEPRRFRRYCSVCSTWHSSRFMASRWSPRHGPVVYTYVFHGYDFGKKDYFFHGDADGRDGCFLCSIRAFP